MRPTLASLLLLAALTSASADAEFVGMFMQGKRIGYVHTLRFHETDGDRTVTSSNINAILLGQAMKLEIKAESWSKKGRLSKQVFVIESGGRSQRIFAVYEADKVSITRTSDGATDKKTVQIPEGALVIDDPTFGIVGKGAPQVGSKLVFYSLDPMLLELIKNEAEFMGEKEITVDGKQMKALLIKVAEPRATTDVYVDRAGEFVYASGLLGITMKPITRQEALGDESYAPEVDLATATKITPDKPIENQEDVTRLVLELKGGDLKRLKSDHYQTATRLDSDTIKLDIHPPVSGSAIATQKPATEYLEPGLNVPSNDEEFTRLSKTIVGDEKDRHKAALAISNEVNQIMKPKANVGMVRDAREILRTKEGVCRDYATLATTLMRAAGIASKVVAGAVYFDGAFYYHAWVEAWDGKTWIAMDPTLGGGLADATHIKFAEGNPDKAFISFTLDGVKIRVLDVTRKK
ncbi:MAG: transglutaminase domain-containing protein [Armatimonadetes bacterium]|nr:transglutaminase domain-containing protein [Armatimonadota bacterium]